MSQTQAHHNLTNLIKSRLDQNIQSFRSKRDYNRRMAFIVRIALSTLGALAAISIGVKPYFHFEHSEEVFSILALVFSAFVTVVATWEAFFDNKWFWIRYTATLNSLYEIRDDLGYAEANRVTDAELKQFHLRLEQTLQNVNTQWSEKRGKDIERLSSAPAG